MNCPSKQLLAELSKSCLTIREQVQAFQAFSDKQLNHKADKQSWSILECLEHLNLYGDYYLPEIGKGMKRSGKAPAAQFHSGLLGNYFANLMKAESGKKMKSPKDKMPVASTLSRRTIDRFLRQLEQLEQLLQMADCKNLDKVKVSISLNRLIRLKLGDTFRFYVYHIERHVAQAERVHGL